MRLKKLIVRQLYFSPIRRHTGDNWSVVFDGAVHGSVRLSGMLSQYLKKYWTYFLQTFSTGTFRDKDEHFKCWGSEGQSSRSRWVQRAGKMHFLALLTWYLEYYWTEFHQTVSFYEFWDKDEHFSFGGQKVKGQGHSMTKSLAGGGVHSLTLCIEL